MALLRRAGNVARLSTATLDLFTVALFCFQCCTLSFSHTHIVFLQCFRVFHVEHYFVTFNFIIMEKTFALDRALAVLSKDLNVSQVLFTVGVYMQSLDFKEQVYFIEEAEKRINKMLPRLDQ